MNTHFFRLKFAPFEKKGYLCPEDNKKGEYTRIPTKEKSGFFLFCLPKK